MPPQDSPSVAVAPVTRRSWREVARIIDFVEARSAGRPMTELAAAEGVPRGTLYYWRARKERIDAPPTVRDFFEGEDGLEVLHRIVLAAHFVFVQVRGCGVDSVGGPESQP